VYTAYQQRGFAGCRWACAAAGRISLCGETWSLHRIQYK